MKKNIVLVYLLRLNKVSDSYNEYMMALTESRKRRIHEMKLENEKYASIGAGFLMHSVLGVEKDEEIAYSPDGKPYLKSQKCFFNISHGGEYVALAVADGDIGIDIEPICAAENIKNIPSKAFTKDEREWLAKHQSDESFIMLWTGKEAVLKADGKGFSRDPQSISILRTKAFYIEHKTLENHIVSCAMKKNFGMEFIYV